MFGGGHRKDDGLPAVSTANIFSALERKSGKKKADKHALHIGENKKQQEDAGQFWVPSPVTVASWADVEDDDDYFATTAPPPAIWGQTKTKAHESSVIDALSHLEESEGEEDIDDDGEEETEEEPAEVVRSGQAEQRPQTPVRDIDKQLSKKEIKKKELAELAAVLAEFGVSTETKQEKSEHDDQTVPIGDADANNETEKKSSKKKKAKKDKTTSAPPSVPVIMEEIESNVTAITEPMDVLIKKKLVAVKKKKSVKENSSAATSKVAAEAAARAAKLAAAKKKEKTHYNQQPAR